MVGDMYTEVPRAFSHHNGPVFLALYWKFITEKRKEQDKNVYYDLLKYTVYTSRKLTRGSSRQEENRHGALIRTFTVKVGGDERMRRRRGIIILPCWWPCLP